jgi:hypothetical protein
MSGNIYQGLLLGPLGGKKSQRAQVHLPKLKDREQSKERVKRLRWFVVACLVGVDPLDSLEAKTFRSSSFSRVMAANRQSASSAVK